MALPAEHGIGGSGVEDLSITLNLQTNYDASGIRAASEDAKEYTNIVQNIPRATSQTTQASKDMAEGIREEIAPIRSVSWDLILMGRSMSILNTTFFGSNQLIKDATGLIYGIGAALRIYVTIKDIERVLTEKGIINSIKQIAQNHAEAASYGEVATAAGAAATAKGAAAVVGLAAAPFTGGLSMLGGIMGLVTAQSGGYVGQTGMALIHKGETIIPSGTSMNIININMTTGGISSSVDVDRMLDAMALRMTQESRRRLGGGV